VIADGLVAESDRQPLVILGSDAFAEEVADLVRQSGDYEVAAFAENGERERCRARLQGLPVVWVDDLAPLAATHRAVSALPLTPLRRRFVVQARELGFDFATVRHPTALISPTSDVGAGGVVSAGVVVAAHTGIGDHVLLNRGVLIGHHSRIGDFVTVSPGANIAGCVTVGVGAFIGMGAVVLDRRGVGAHAVGGAGAVVTKDVPERVQVLGVPARVVKRAE
jgi:acetyltransferase EpsM